MKCFFIIKMLLLLSFFLGCTTSDQAILQTKTKCYAGKLIDLKKSEIYNEVMEKFVDTFKVMKSDKRYFGVSEVVSNKIDEAIFFNEGQSECLLIVLQKNNYGLVFGSARIIRGEQNSGRWIFKPSIEYTYSKDYFEKYPDNNFDNISELACYSVLTDGEVKKRSCEIDEKYWFEELKR
ncbi:MAG: hypothetical protein KBF82_12215 [Chitinophagaceae bacterium]|nr:hypothetical protein [Chitinophagaceae bacterium]MBP9104624.1 hypothetical protein [Chitinophagaceae bacterium]